MTRRTLAHARDGTVPLADGVGRVPVVNYFDGERWGLEMERVFGRLPLVLGLSAELPEPFDYKAVDMGGVPVVVSRRPDGEIAAFINACSHRGAIVVPEGAGNARRFTCPYHAWTYDGDGRLVGITDRDDFGAVETGDLGLTRLPSAERSGLIFVGLHPDSALNVDTFLCGYDEMLDHLGLADCHVVGSQTVSGPNWKVAYDGYVDFYHLPILHRNSFGSEISNKAIYDAWGPHQRVTSPDRRMMSLAEVAEADWSHDVLTTGIWTVFPHTSIASFTVKPDGIEGGGRMFMVSTLFPGADPETSVTVQTFLAAFDVTPALRPAIHQQQEFLLRVVRDEDYFTGLRIQRAAKTAANSEFLFGRNEAGGQRFHRWVDDLVAAESEAAVAELFANAETVHQP